MISGGHQTKNALRINMPDKTSHLQPPFSNPIIFFSSAKNSFFLRLCFGNSFLNPNFEAIYEVKLLKIIRKHYSEEVFVDTKIAVLHEKLDKHLP